MFIALLLRDCERYAPIRHGIDLELVGLYLLGKRR